MDEGGGPHVANTKREDFAPFVVGGEEVYEAVPLDREPQSVCARLINFITLRDSTTSTQAAICRTVLLAIIIIATAATFAASRENSGSNAGVTSQTLSPTTGPTSSPTNTSAVFPTSIPTLKPPITAAPTVVPTVQPPTGVPVASPTLVPSPSCNIEEIIPVVFGVPAVLNVINAGLNCFLAGYFEPSVFSAVTSLVVQFNDIPTIPSGAFVGLDSLSSLKLQNNNIKTVEAEAFKSLTNLEVLNLFSSGFSGGVESLNATAFTDLLKLRELHMRTYELSSLDPGTFWSMKELETLYLRSIRGGITLVNRAGLTIPENSFANQRKIVSFDIGGLSVGPELGGEDLPMLSNETMRSLRLEACGIESVKPDVLSKFTFLLHLELDANGITSVPEGLTTTLEIFDSKSNKLSTLGALTTLTKLKRLLLNGNMFTTIEPELKRLTMLQSLDLYGNQINAQLEDNFFGEFADLARLDMGSNDKLDLVNDSFAGLTALEFLRLERSGITKLPPLLLKDLSKLESLILNNNEFSELPKGFFDSVPGLTFLELSRNEPGLKFPEGIFRKLTALTILRAYGVISALEYPCAEVFASSTGLHDISILEPSLPPC